MKLFSGIVLVLAAAVAVAGPALAPQHEARQFRDFLYAPPMPIRIRDAGQWRAPFVYPLRLINRVERRFVEDRSRRITLAWFSGGKFVRAADERGGPVLLLGADSLGRDVLARLVSGARMSLGVAALGVFGAILLGTLAGGVAGFTGGPTDDALMRLAEFVMVLPAIYVILALRSVMPLVLPPSTIFLLISGLLALIGWPSVARGVRAIVATERQRDYVAAATSIGAGRARLLCRHLLPATRGFLLVQVTLLLPAFILAEATLSYVGLGFVAPTSSWGAMLQEAANVRVLADFPWLLSPAGAIIAIVLGLNLINQSHWVGTTATVASGVPPASAGATSG